MLTNPPRTSHSLTKQKTFTDHNDNTTIHDYNDQGSPILVDSPDTGRVSFEYDPSGRLTSRTDADGNKTTCAYDDQGRLIGVFLPDQKQTVGLAYEQDRLSCITDPSCTSSYTWTESGRLETETKAVLGIEYKTAYEYDEQGRVAAITYPSGQRIEYIRDEQGRVTSVETDDGLILALNITYLDCGRMSGLVHGNEVVVAREFDKNRRLKSLIADGVMDLEFDRDKNGNITAIADHLNPPQSQVFVYDERQRLVKAAGPYGVIKYAYDPVGNRRSRELNGRVETYSYQAGTNRLKEISGPDQIRFEYDQAGQMVSKNEMSLGYDPLGRLVKAEVGGQVSEYIYIANNQRVIKICGENVTIFHYDQSGLLIAETDEFGNTLREYVYLDNELISIIDPSEKDYHVHTNHRQEPQSVTDEHGNVIWQSFSTPFGQAEVDEDPGNTGRPFHLNIRLPGQYFDQETGLHYNWHRFYDPGIGRYISPDPIGLDGGDVNLYAYVGGNPVNWTDVMGLWFYKGYCGYATAGAGALAKIPKLTPQSALATAALSQLPLGAGVLICDMETDCVNHVKEEGTVVVGLVGFAFGSPFGISGFKIVQQDTIQGDKPSLSALQGPAKLNAMGGAYGGGLSGMMLYLGSTISFSLGPQLGLDWGKDDYGGYSLVFGVEKKKC